MGSGSRVPIVASLLSRSPLNRSIVRRTGGYVADDGVKTATYSGSYRLQRTAIEAVDVSVPVTPDVTVPQPDGTVRFDCDRLEERAVDLARAKDLKWHVEEQRVELHPVQMGPPEPAA